MIHKFILDPTRVGLNYKPIRGSRRMWSLRVNRQYRVIALPPDMDNIHVFLWVDKHNNAYRWAERHRCEINPETGALQLYKPIETDPLILSIGRQTPERWLGLISRARDVTQPTGPFAGLRDRQLVRMGVPSAMVDAVRGLRDLDDLVSIMSHLPREAYEALRFYLDGESCEDIIAYSETAPETVDTEDFGKALTQDDSRSRFVVIDDADDIEEVMTASLEEWRVFLHPTQRRSVEREWNGPVRILGGAGTGKTVAAMHRARWLARNQPEPGRILFLTYAVNLAADIRKNLREFCKHEEMERIDVYNLDKWLSDYCKRKQYAFKVSYGIRRKVWAQAMANRAPSLNVSDEFYRNEWDQVILARGVTTLAGYLDVDRKGRGTGLNAADRTAMWPVFDAYRSLLARTGWKARVDVYREAASMLAEDRDLGYSAVIVDESQDMGPQEFRLIRAMVPEGKNDLFLVGDGHQKIHRSSQVVLAHCGINIKGRSRKLRLSYRTTEQIRRWAIRLLEGRYIDDMDGDKDDSRGFISLTRGPDPKLERVSSESEQADWIAHYLNSLNEETLPREVCVVARTNYEVDSIARLLSLLGIDTITLKKKKPDIGSDGKVRLATMHRVKGLEFERVIIANANKGMLPNQKVLDSAGDTLAREQIMTRELSLAYVAATRAKKELFVISYGEPSELFWPKGK